MSKAKSEPASEKKAVQANNTVGESFFPAVDKHNLDEEWIAHGERMGVYTKRLAVAKGELAVAKGHLAATKAEVKEKIRRNPDRYCHLTSAGKAPAETRVDDLVLIQPEYMEALSDFNEAAAKVDRLDAILSTLDHIRDELKGLQYLWGAGYFASATKIPKPRGGGD